MIPHKRYMQMAIALAKRGTNVSPNPKVGCIIVKRGQIIGKGFHKEFGGPHAEVHALEQAKHKAKDSIMYVTLEPCSHWGKTPPCTEKIVNSGVREVVIGMKDPNPKVNGFEILKLRGVKTRISILEEDCKNLNKGYNKYMRKKLPYVVLKAGMTLDGKIATHSGKSKYITGRDSLKHVHKLREELEVVMVGITTVLKDDPKLDTRLIKGKETTKLVIDSKLKIPPKAKLLKHPKSLIIACSHSAPKKKMKMLEDKGVRFIQVKMKGKHLDMKPVMKGLAKLGFLTVLLEGGSMVNASMIKEKLVDKVMLFTSPKILGDDGIGVIGKLGVKELNKVVNIKNINYTKFGKDMLIEGEL